MPITLPSDSARIHKISHVNDQFVFCAVPLCCAQQREPPHPIFRPISAASPLSGLYQPPSLPPTVMCSSMTTIYNVIHHPLSVLRSRVTWSVRICPYSNHSHSQTPGMCVGGKVLCKCGVHCSLFWQPDDTFSESASRSPRSPIFQLISSSTPLLHAFT